MMDAMSGGDLINNDLAKEMGNMMMMRPMMGAGMNPMMAGGAMSAGYRYPMAQSYQYQTTVTPTPTSSASGFGSRLPGAKRGSIYDNLWEMNMMNNLMNQGAAGAGASATSPTAADGTSTTPATPNSQQPGIDLNNLATWEMAVGDAPAPVTPGAPVSNANEIIIDTKIE